MTLSSTCSQRGTWPLSLTNLTLLFSKVRDKAGSSRVWNMTVVRPFACSAHRHTLLPIRSLYHGSDFTAGP